MKSCRVIGRNRRRVDNLEGDLNDDSVNSETKENTTQKSNIKIGSPIFPNEFKVALVSWASLIVIFLVSFTFITEIHGIQISGVLMVHLLVPIVSGLFVISLGLSLLYMNHEEFFVRHKKTFQYLGFTFACVFSVVSIGMYYFHFTPYSYTTSYHFSGAMFTILLGAGSCLFLGFIFKVIRKEHLNFVNVKKIMICILLFVICVSFFLGASSIVISNQQDQAQNLPSQDLWIPFLADNGGFKDLDEDEASLQSTYFAYFSMNDKEKKAVNETRLVEYLTELVRDGFKSTEKEIPTIINCYMIVHLLSEAGKKGTKFLREHFDLFISFISTESSYDWMNTIKYGEPTALTRETLFWNHLELKYYTILSLKLLLESQKMNFDQFLRNASLNFELSHVRENAINEIQLIWNQQDAFFSNDVIYSKNLEDLFYISQIMDVIITNKNYKKTIEKQLFKLDSFGNKVLEAVEYENGKFILSGTTTTNHLKLNYIICRLLANIHSLHLLDTDEIRNYTEYQRINDNFARISLV